MYTELVTGEEEIKGHGIDELTFSICLCRVLPSQGTNYVHNLIFKCSVQSKETILRLSSSCVRLFSRDIFVCFE